MHWTGNIVRPRVCSETACASQVDLHADEISAEKLNLLLNPNIRKQPWYRILTGSTQRSGAALRELSVEGTLQANRFAVGDLVAERITTQVKLGNGRLHLSDFRGTLLGGTHMGDWQADFTKEPPAYTLTGALEKVFLTQLAKPTRNNWITGTARGSYEITLNGWNEADLRATARGTLALFARDGTLTHFGPAGPLKFGRLEATFTAGESLVVISEGRLENAQGVYAVSGVASLAHKVDLKFVRDAGHGFVVSGTLEDPHVGTLGDDTSKAEVRKPYVPDRDR